MYIRVQSVVVPKILCWPPPGTPHVWLMSAPCPLVRISSPSASWPVQRERSDLLIRALTGALPRAFSSIDFFSFLGLLCLFLFNYIGLPLSSIGSRRFEIARGSCLTPIINTYSPRLLIIDSSFSLVFLHLSFFSLSLLRPIRSTRREDEPRKRPGWLSTFARWRRSREPSGGRISHLLFSDYDFWSFFSIFLYYLHIFFLFFYFWFKLLFFWLNDLSLYYCFYLFVFSSFYCLFFFT